MKSNPRCIISEISKTGGGDALARDPETGRFIPSRLLELRQATERLPVGEAIAMLRRLEEGGDEYAGAVAGEIVRLIADVQGMDADALGQDLGVIGEGETLDPEEDAS